jgi:hypothetical protein
MNEKMLSEKEHYETTIRSIESYIDWLKNNDRPEKDIINACNNLVKYIQEKCPIEFKIGESVRLVGKSGIVMHINDIDGEIIECTWITKGKQETGRFNRKLLRISGELGLGTSSGGR